MCSGIRKIKVKPRKIKVVEPEELNAKIGTMEESFWTDLKTKLESEIKNAKRSIEINEHIIAYTEIRIEQEQKDLNT